MKRARAEDPIVYFNVGGLQRMATRRSTILGKWPESMLGGLLRFPQPLPEEGVGEIFIDMSPERFALILDYLRLGVPPGMTNIQRHNFLQDVQYLGLPRPVVLREEHLSYVSIVQDWIRWASKPKSRPGMELFDGMYIHLGFCALDDKLQGPPVWFKFLSLRESREGLQTFCHMKNTPFPPYFTDHMADILNYLGDKHVLGMPPRSVWQLGFDKTLSKSEIQTCMARLEIVALFRYVMERRCPTTSLPTTLKKPYGRFISAGSSGSVRITCLDMWFSGDEGNYDDLKDHPEYSTDDVDHQWKTTKTLDMDLLGKYGMLESE